jgi:hypothetical protein
MKTILVKCAKWEEMIEIDDTIFDDFKAEACTRCIEKHFRSGKFNVSAFMHCSLVVKGKTKKLSTYNTYKILINAGYHRHAEVLREMFLEENKIDLAMEPIMG